MRILALVLVLASPALGGDLIELGATALTTDVTIEGDADPDEWWVTDAQEADNLAIFIFSFPGPASATDIQWSIISTMLGAGSAHASTDQHGSATSGSSLSIKLTGDHEHARRGRLQVSADDGEGDSDQMLITDFRCSGGADLVAVVASETHAGGRYAVGTGAATSQAGNLVCSLTVNWRYVANGRICEDTFVCEDD